MGRLPIFEPPNDLVAGSIYHEILSLTVSAALYLATFEFISKNQSNLCKKLKQDGQKDRQYWIVTLPYWVNEKYGVADEM